MKKEENIRSKFESLSELHRLLGLPKPTHPLISLIKVEDSTEIDSTKLPQPFVYNFYKIAYKTNLTGKLKYGQNYYDFDEGGLFFKAPNQVSADGENNGDFSGYTLVFHPDFLLHFPLARRIKQYGFFSYSVNEALHLSEKEQATIISVFKHIEDELQNRIDNFSQSVIISHIEALLNYSDRFYQRQFITRKAVNNDVLENLESILNEYFNSDKISKLGIPTVQYVADALNLSPSYLSDLLRNITGQNAQQHIHNFLIEKAKEVISTTSLTVSEIAFQLGFEHQSSFNKFFKAKTNLSPLQFRQSFN